MVDYITKASFKDCPIQERETFKVSKCILPVSVDQSLCEGKKFAATIELVNRTFKECVILVDDYIQRYTLQFMYPDVDEEIINQRSIALGDIWLENHRNIYSSLDIPYKIMRWKHWLAHSKFSTQHEVIKKSYNTNSQYREAIDGTVTAFLSRLKQPVSNEKQAFEKSLQYLVEECAVMTLWVDEGCEFELSV